MSDHGAPDHDTPGPMDRAYVQAEALLDDAQAHAARRARVLAAVAAEPTHVETPPAPRRAAWSRGGWLVAASIAVVGVLVAQQIPSTFTPAPPTAPPRLPPTPSPGRAAPAAPPAATAEAPAAVTGTKPPASRAAPSVPRTAEPIAPTAPAAAPQPPPAAPAQPPSPPPSALPPLPVPPVEHRIEEPRPPTTAARALAQAPSSGEINELVVTAERRQSPRDEKAGLLRAAAEAGQADEVAALLAKGAPVDLPDAAGDTALMKSVRADHPATAILLRRHGANLDRRNQAGQSARDLAATVADPELDRALGLKP